MKGLDFMKRRWLEARFGHSTYLIFFIQFAQFIVVTYGLYIQDHAPLNTIFPSVYHWFAFFIATYIPAAVYVGRQHLHKQIPTETRQMTANNPYTFQAVPGKETLYSLPATVTGYDLQLKGMHMHNQLIDFYKKAFGVELEKWDKADFETVTRLRDMTARLQKGENINDIIKNA